MSLEKNKKCIQGFIRFHRRRLVFVKIKYCCDYSFIHINKTGGSSIERALKAPLIHEPATVFRENIGVDRWKKRFSFSIIRNPWDRAVSHYHYRQLTNQTGLCDTKLTFEEWINKVYVERSAKYMDEAQMFETQSSWITDKEGNIIVDYIGRFENLDESWAEICRRLGRKASPLPHVKKSYRRDYKEYYNDSSRGIIHDFFKDDINAFGYSF